MTVVSNLFVLHWCFYFFQTLFMVEKLFIKTFPFFDRKYFSVFFVKFKPKIVLTFMVKTEK